MYTNRIFKAALALVLATALAFTVQEAIATRAIRSDTGRACSMLPSAYSISSAYVPEAKMWILRTEEGPTGVDGGLIELLSGHTDCSR